MDKQYVDLFSALLTPVLAIVAAYIAYQQWRLAKFKWRLALYEKRFETYRTVVEFISFICRNGDCPEIDRVRFLQTASRNNFLFDESIEGNRGQATFLDRMCCRVNPNSVGKCCLTPFLQNGIGYQLKLRTTVLVQTDGLDRYNYMKKHYLILVLLCFGLSTVTAEEKFLTSPSGAFLCKMVPGNNGTGQIVIFRDKKTAKETKLLTTDRWAEVVWSGKDEWFAIIDHYDGQASTLRIYEVLRGRYGEVVEIGKEYETPSPGAIGIEWSLVGWSEKKGTAQIKRTEVIKHPLSMARHRIEESYTVPIE